MASRAKVEGTDAIVAQFVAMAKDPKRRDVSGRVGYAAPYALVVHERQDVYHPNGEAKFLEKAIRRHQADVSRSIAADLKKGLPLRSAVLNALRKLKEASDAMVPVKTGYLLRSGFVKTYYI